MSVNKILAIAITDYDDAELNKLENCYDDLKEIIGVLNEMYVFDEVDFIHKKEETTRSALYARLNEYFINTLNEDNILLLFAGHGQYNEKLGMAYWQPSDASPNDPSSWLNINDVLAFVKAADAFHVSIISDSCFAGAIFDPPKRGGGLEALKTKKSRLALTSGGVEKVSDGRKGEKSPFANTLIKALLENEKAELPFNILASNVIVQFDKSRKQTPQFGSLYNVGHEGGTFVFEKRNALKETDIVGEKNAYLSKEMGNLFIPVQHELFGDIDNIVAIKEEKNKVVKQQRFEEAAALRDKERAFEDALKTKTKAYIESLVSDLKFSEDDIARSKDLDARIEEYEKELEKQTLAYKQELQKFEEETERLKKSTSVTSIEVASVPIVSQRAIEASGTFIYSFLSTKEHPAIKYFNDNKEVLIQKLEASVVSMFKHFKFLQCETSNQVIVEKADALKEILFKIYDFEIDILLGKFHSYVDKTLQKKELEIDLLNWIKNQKQEWY